MTGDLDPIEWALSRINNGLLKVEQEQAHFRIREQNHRDCELHPITVNSCVSHGDSFSFESG